MLTGRGFPHAVSHAWRASGIARTGWRRTAPPLPHDLRERLLGIPEASPRRAAVAPRSVASDADSGWLLASPFAPLAASFVLAVGISLWFGNPYQVGATTVSEVRAQVSPAASRLRLGASRIAGAAVDLGEAAALAVPRAGRRASYAISNTIAQLEDAEGDRARSRRPAGRVAPASLERGGLPAEAPPPNDHQPSGR